jgi:hypothetical protein
MNHYEIRNDHGRPSASALLSQQGVSRGEV